MRKLLAAVPMTVIHVACCGGALLLLASSGWLVVLSSEAQSKLALLPLILMTAAAFWLWRRQVAHCKVTSHAGVIHAIVRELTLMFAILLTSVLILVYVVIPLWIGDYQGEGLLPG